MFLSNFFFKFIWLLIINSFILVQCFGNYQNTDRDKPFNSQWNDYFPQSKVMNNPYQNNAVTYHNSQSSDNKNVIHYSPPVHYNNPKDEETTIEYYDEEIESTSKSNNIPSSHYSNYVKHNSQHDIDLLDQKATTIENIDENLIHTVPPRHYYIPKKHKYPNVDTSPSKPLTTEKTTVPITPLPTQEIKTTFLNIVPTELYTTKNVTTSSVNVLFTEMTSSTIQSTMILETQTPINVTVETLSLNSTETQANLNTTASPLDNFTISSFYNNTVSSLNNSTTSSLLNVTALPVNNFTTPTLSTSTTLSKTNNTESFLGVRQENLTTSSASITTISPVTDSSKLLSQILYAALAASALKSTSTPKPLIISTTHVPQAPPAALNVRQEMVPSTSSVNNEMMSKLKQLLATLSAQSSIGLQSSKVDPVCRVDKYPLQGNGMCMEENYEAIRLCDSLLHYQRDQGNCSRNSVCCFKNEIISPIGPPLSIPYSQNPSGNSYNYNPPPLNYNSPPLEHYKPSYANLSPDLKMVYNGASVGPGNQIYAN